MKKYTLILFFFIALCAKAQGNLQFNQVINYQGAASNGTVPCGPINGHNCNSSPIWTVPQGKVWKIESSNCNGTVVNDGGWAAYWMSLKINGNDILGGYSTTAQGFWINGPIQFPIWINAGSTLQCVILGAPATTRYFISIIEFNII